MWNRWSKGHFSTRKFLSPKHHKKIVDIIDLHWNMFQRDGMSPNCSHSNSTIHCNDSSIILETQLKPLSAKGLLNVFTVIMNITCGSVEHAHIFWHQLVPNSAEFQTCELKVHSWSTCCTFVESHMTVISSIEIEIAASSNFWLLLLSQSNHFVCIFVLLEFLCFLFAAQMFQCFTWENANQIIFWDDPKHGKGLLQWGSQIVWFWLPPLNSPPRCCLLLSHFPPPLLTWVPLLPIVFPLILLTAVLFFATFWLEEDKRQAVKEKHKTNLQSYPENLADRACPGCHMWFVVLSPLPDTVCGLFPLDPHDWETNHDLIWSLWCQLFAFFAFFAVLLPRLISLH